MTTTFIHQNRVVMLEVVGPADDGTWEIGACDVRVTAGATVSVKGLLPQDRFQTEEAAISASKACAIRWIDQRATIGSTR